MVDVPIPGSRAKLMRLSSKKEKEKWLKNDDKPRETHPLPHQDVQDGGEEDQVGAQDEQMMKESRKQVRCMPLKHLHRGGDTWF